MVYEPGGFTFLPGLLIMASPHGWWSSLLSQTGKICLEFIQYQFHNFVIISVFLWTTELKKCWLASRMLWQGLCGLRVQLYTRSSASIYRCETVGKFLVSCVSYYPFINTEYLLRSSCTRLVQTASDERLANRSKMLWVDTIKIHVEKRQRSTGCIPKKLKKEKKGEETHPDTTNV